MAQTDFASLRTMALAYCAVDGTAYIDDLTDSISNTAFTAVANEVLKRVSEETKGLFSDSVTFTLTPNALKYSLRDTAVFGSEMLDIQRVYINKQPILQTSEEDASRISPTYLTDASGPPAFWFRTPPEQIVLCPAPDQAYSNSLVSGWYIHPTITADSGAGGTIMFRPEDMRMIAKEICVAILEPRALGTSLQRLLQFKGENQIRKLEILAASIETKEGATSRRECRAIYTFR